MKLLIILGICIALFVCLQASETAVQAPEEFFVGFDTTVKQDDGRISKQYSSIYITRRNHTDPINWIIITGNHFVNNAN